MRKQLQGIGLILFGILLTFLAGWPLTGNDIISALLSFILPWLGLIGGIIGAALLFQSDNSDKR